MSRGRVVLLLAFCGLLRSPVLRAQASTQPQIIVEAVKISGAPHLPNEVRARVASLVRGREYEGTPDKWIGDLGACPSNTKTGFSRTKNQ